MLPYWTLRTSLFDVIQMGGCYCLCCCWRNPVVTFLLHVCLFHLEASLIVNTLKPGQKPQQQKEKKKLSSVLSAHFLWD